MIFMRDSKHKKVLLLILGQALVIGIAVLVCAGCKNKNKDAENPAVTIPPAGEISVRGMMTCLPHRNTEGPQTLECAFGLKDEQGRFFALRDTDSEYKNISNVSHDVVVIVKGTFTSKEDDRYQSIGIINVKSVTAADAPQRATLSGTYVCLPHKNTTGPQTDECAFGLKLADGTYYAVDFAAMSQTAPELQVGDMISASGVIVPIERLSTDRWNIYPVKGIFSVTDSVKKL